MDGEKIYIVNPATGKRGYVDKSEMDTWSKAGYQPESGAATEDARLQEEYGDSPIQTAAERFTGMATFGLSDATVGQLDEEGFRERAQRNRAAGFVGEGLGALATGGIGAGGLLAEGAEAAAGAVTAGRAAGAGTRILGAATRGAVEGVGYGVGTGVSQVALSPEPLTWEGAAATIGTNALVGAGAGGLLGTGAGLLGEGATAAKNFANKQVEKITAGEQAVDRGAFPEYAAMDQKAAGKELGRLEEARKAQKATDIADTDNAIAAHEDVLKGQQAEGSKSLYQKAKDFKKFASKNFIPSKAEEAATLGGSMKKIRRGTNNRTGFIESNGKKGSFQTGLQEQETALENVLANKPQVMAEAEAAHADLVKSLPEAVPEPEAYAAGPVRIGEDNLPQWNDIHPEGTHVVQTTANDLAERGLFEMPGAGRDEVRMNRVRENLGKREEWDQPIRVSMDEQGKFFVEDGRHRLRAALEEGGDRPLEIHIGRSSKGVDAAGGEGTVQLGGASKLEPGVAEATEAALPKVAKAKVYLTPEQSVLYRDFAGMKQIVKGEPKAMAIDAEQLAAFRQAIDQGLVQPLPVMRMERAEAVLEKNRELQAEFRKVQGDLDSPTLRQLKTKREQIKADTTPTPRETAIKAHLEDLKSPNLGRTIAQGIGGALGGSAGSVGGPIGSITGAFIGRDVGNQLYDKFVRKIMSGNASRMNTIKKTIATMFEKGASATSRALPKATKIVASLRYADPKHVDAVLGPDNTRESKNQAVNDFRQRSRELNSVTQPGPNGVYQARMTALEGLHNRMAAIWAISPEVANGIEKLQAAKWEFLATKMPRNPAPPYLQVGPDNWEPDHALVAKFARYMHAAEHPEEVVENFAAGKGTPEDVETLKTLYPSHYEEVRKQCMDHASQMRRTLPYVQRLNLSILLDVPVDPALTPEAMSVYQAPKPDPTQQQAKPAQQKPMPMGTIEPTAAQHASAS